jgi:hypothetical protein
MISETGKKLRFKNFVILRTKYGRIPIIAIKDLITLTKKRRPEVAKILEEVYL